MAAVALFLFLMGVLAMAALFATSASMRSIVRKVRLEHEPTLFLPASDWYMPQNVFGNFRPSALLRRQPNDLMALPGFRASIVLARVLAIITVAAVFGAIACGFAA